MELHKRYYFAETRSPDYYKNEIAPLYVMADVLKKQADNIDSWVIPLPLLSLAKEPTGAYQSHTVSLSIRNGDDKEIFGIQYGRARKAGTWFAKESYSPGLYNSPNRKTADDIPPVVALTLHEKDFHVYQKKPVTIEAKAFGKRYSLPLDALASDSDGNFGASMVEVDNKDGTTDYRLNFYFALSDDALALLRYADAITFRFHSAKGGDVRYHMPEECVKIMNEFGMELKELKIPMKEGAY